MTTHEKWQECRRGCRLFNMIEIVLAIGAIAIGMVSIMALFPVGLSANRDAIAENYAADSAEEMLHYLAVKAKQSWSGYMGGGKLGVVKPSATEPAFLPTPVVDDGSIYLADTSDDNLKVSFYKIIQKASESDIVDYSAIYRVWYTQLSISGTDVPTGIAGCLHVEASWPAELPYGNRQKSEYQLEVFNPNY